MKKKPIHYIMWQIGMGGAELSVVHYINRFNGERELNTYSLRPIHRKVYDENKIFVRESSEYSWKGYLEYFHYCRKFRHHLFHLLNVGPVILFLTLIAGNKSPIYHIHGTLHWRKPYQKWYLRLFWWLSSWFSFRIIANSKHAVSIF